MSGNLKLSQLQEAITVNSAAAGKSSIQSLLRRGCGQLDGFLLGAFRAFLLLDSIDKTLLLQNLSDS
jgi:hypothetical protein